MKSFRRSLRKVRFGSERDRRSDGHLAAGAGQFTCRKWSVVMAMPGQFVGNTQFASEQPNVSVPVSDSLTLELAARNADSLDKATNYHIDAGGFDSVLAAREAAEALGIRLRLLNAILNLGLNIPIEDKMTLLRLNNLYLSTAEGVSLGSFSWSALNRQRWSVFNRRQQRGIAMMFLSAMRSCATGFMCLARNLTRRWT